MVALIIVMAILAVIFLFIGGKEMIGEWLTSLLPKDRMSVGDKVNVFMNGEYNRTATITRIKADTLYIYDTIPLPIAYRGSFYATGVCQDDGSKLVFVKTRKYYKFVRVAEIIRKAFNVIDDTDNLQPTEPAPAEVSADPVPEGDDSSVNEGEREDAM